MIWNIGHGANLCPGRFFASLETKIMLVKLFIDHKYEISDPKGRPENLKAREFIFPNPKGELLMRRRRASERLAV